VAPVAKEELLMVRAEEGYRRVIKALTDALAQGAARGTVGDLDTSDMSTEGLDQGVDIAKQHGTRTIRARHLLALVHFVWKVRRAVMQGSWDSAKSLLDTASDLLGESSALPVGCVVPHATLHEIRLLRAEASNRKIISQARTAL